MRRSVGLTGLIIVMSLAIGGFAAFSSPSGSASTGVDVADIDARATAAVLAAPLVGTVAPALQVVVTPVEVPLEDPTADPGSTSSQSQRIPATTTTTTTTPTTTVGSKTTSTQPAPTTTTTTVPATTTTPTIPVATTTTVPVPSDHPPSVEQWRGLVATYFPASRVEEALRIIDCESNGDPNDSHAVSGAAGLFQFIPSTWNWVAGQMGLPNYASGAPYDPASNTAAAAWLVQDSIDSGSSPWSQWSCRWVLG